MTDFQGRTALITGGADGISKGAALLLAQRGAEAIAIADLNADLAAQTAADITSETGARAFAVEVNVADPDSITAMVSHAVDQLDHVDYLVNGAGVMRTYTIEQTTPEAWDAVVDINMRGSFLASRAVFPHMAERGFGSIVNVSSVAARIGGIASGVDYAASKGGVVAMTKSLAKQGGPQGIRVNSVAPGVIHTKMTAGTEYSAAGIPLGRLGEVIDVATGIVFLLSDDAGYITGTTLDINGGSYMN